MINNDHEVASMKAEKIKMCAFDLWTNGGTYFYYNLRPSFDLMSKFDKVIKPVQPNAIEEKKKEVKDIEKKGIAKCIPKFNPKVNCNFIEYYKTTYGHCSKPHELLFVLNKFTTPKENVRERKVNKKDREQLSKFDFPISMMSINPLGIQYTELFSLSRAIYIKLKDELRILEFINRYFSLVLIQKIELKSDDSYNEWDDSQDEKAKIKKSELLDKTVLTSSTYEIYKHNHNLLSGLDTQKFVKIEDEKEKKEDIKRLDSVKLSEIFNFDQNFQTIFQSLTCQNAKIGYDYELLEFFGDAIIALLSRFETVIVNPRFNENQLDQERLKKESNMRFEKVAKEFELSNYMINEDVFLPPLFRAENFENILYLKKNEMNNKQLLFKSMLESNISALDNPNDLRYELLGLDSEESYEEVKEFYSKRTRKVSLNKLQNSIISLFPIKKDRNKNTLRP